jgi:20S proteasome subunit beta 5
VDSSQILTDYSVRTEELSRLPLPLNELQYHGTTTLSFKCADGIIIAIDSRASVGNYVGSRTVKKIFPVNKHIIATMAGGAADCAHWIRLLARRVAIIEEQYSTKLLVKGVAMLLTAQLRDFKGTDISVGSMVAGMDQSGFSIYYVDSDAACVEGDIFCVGSGANLAYSILDAKVFSDSDSESDCGDYSVLKTLSADDAAELALEAIRAATHRDAFSGGFINVFHIDKSGVQHIINRDAKEVNISKKL